MPYREHTPSPALRAHVACYWTLRSTSPGDGRRVLPDGCIDLLFNLGDPVRRVESAAPAPSSIAPTGAQGAPTLVGVMSRPMMAVATGRVDLLGIRFQPGEAFAYLGVAARAWRDGVIALDEVWGAAGRELGARVAEAPGTAARIALIERALLARREAFAPFDPRVRAVIAAMRAARGNVAIPALARQIGLGERQLERTFQERVGLAPKALARVIRLEALLDVLGSGCAFTWSQLSAALGFADQAHLIREVNALAGVTPRALARERARTDLLAPDQDGAAPR